MEFTKVVAERYSCKNFSTRKVEAEKLTEILEAGRLAPTAKNSQEQRIYVLQAEESLAMLDKVTPCRYGAPTCLVVAFDKNNVFTYPGGKRDSGMEDAAIVATHLMLAAASRGLDTLWICMFKPEAVRAEFNLPEHVEPVNILLVGYGAGIPADPGRHELLRKPLSETVVEERFCASAPLKTIRENTAGVLRQCPAAVRSSVEPEAARVPPP